MKAYSKYGTAKRHAAGRPIIRIGNTYIVGAINDLTAIDVIDSTTGQTTAHVCAGKLDVLGNANYCEPIKSIDFYAIKNNTYRNEG